jgi:multidrug transporter EmrE-like cation transporter
MINSKNRLEFWAGIGAALLLVFGVLLPSNPRNAALVSLGLLIGGGLTMIVNCVLQMRRKARGKCGKQ